MSNVKEEAIKELASAMGVSKEIATTILNGMIFQAKLEILAEKVKRV